jgi:O-antigen/teichoic acid export membrane protein
LQLIKNVSWNFIAAVWMAIMTVLVTPLYISKLGLNLYGIIGIWLVFQAIMNLFDFGLGATLTKEFSTVNPREGKVFHNCDTLRTIEIVYWGISAICVVLFILLTNVFFKEWMNLKFVSIKNISTITLLMFISLFFQFPYILYISGLIGLQRHQLVSIIQIIGITLKFGVGVIIFLKKADLIAFFYAQIVVSLLQTFIVRFFLWKQISTINSSKPSFNFKIIKKVSNFSKQMALTSLLAVSISNIDRLFVFKLLPTEDLGRYSLAFTATGFLQLAIQPFYRSFFPRYSELFSNEKHGELEREYFFSNKLISFLIISIAVICIVFADEIFFVWMGKIDQSIILVFRFLILGIMLSGLGWLPAAYQQAIGWPELHVKMMLLSLVVAIPVLVVSIQYFGLLGASFIWLIHGIIDITLGLWIMHKTILKGKLKEWYLNIFLPPFLYAIPIVLISALLKPDGLSRIKTFLWVCLTALLLFALIAAKIRNIIYLKKNLEDEKR